MTLRSRLVLAFVVVVVAVVGTGLAVIAAQRHFLVAQVDAQLRAAALPIERLQPLLGGPPDAITQGNDSHVLSELWIGTGSTGDRLLTRVDGSLSTSKAPRITLSEAKAAAQDRAIVTVPAAGGGHFRVLAFESSATGQVIAIGLSLDHVDAAVRRLVIAVVIGGVVVIAVVALMLWWVWRLGLVPIRRVTRTADAITEGSLDHRVEPAPAGTEAARLALAFNTMLDERQRIEERLRRFVADASHELRTPLTSIRGYSELFLRGGLDEPGRLDDAMRRIREEAERMRVLVEELLLLARLDESRPAAHESVDLAAVLRDARADALASEPSRTVDVSATGPLVVVGDEQQLRQVVGVLVSNALQHTAGDVRLRALHEGATRVVMEVADDGPGMNAEDSARAFDRFYRGESARAGATHSAGLGLAIAAGIVTAHGGSITLESSPASGTKVRAEFDAGGHVATGSRVQDSQEVPSHV